MSQHFKRVCVCGIVIVQCRCASPTKIVEIVAPCTHGGENVPLSSENPSERLYEAHKADIRGVLDKHGVLTHDGWEFITDDLVEDLAKLK